MKNSNGESWKLVGCILDNILVKYNFNNKEYMPSIFDSKEIPNISMHDYLGRLNYYTNCSEACFIYVLIYIEKLLQYNPRFTLTPFNIHKITLGAFILAIKYVDDLYGDNSVYAKIGGIPLTEFNAIEKIMLELINFRLHVKTETFFQYINEIALHSLTAKEEVMKVDEKLESAESLETISEMDDIVEA